MIFDNGKSAAQIAAVTPEPGNQYELDIHGAARFLVKRGDGDWLYLTHYSSGSTLWNGDLGTQIIRRKSIESDPTP